MKSVLISVQPQWCELIFEFLGYDNRRPLYKKRLELRKTKPKLETPFKVYIYCTKPRHYYKISRHLLISDENLFLVNGKVRMCDGFGVEYEDSEYKHLNGKVIGEFVCDYILSHCEMANADVAEQMSCVPREDILKYSNGKEVYGWHISDLVIYDKPRELGEFYNECEKPECDDCPYLHFENTPNSYEGWCEFNEKIPLKRPPQSWCYVECLI